MGGRHLKARGCGCTYLQGHGTCEGQALARWTSSVCSSRPTSSSSRRWRCSWSRTLRRPRYARVPACWHPPAHAVLHRTACRSCRHASCQLAGGGLHRGACDSENLIVQGATTSCAHGSLTPGSCVAADSCTRAPPALGNMVSESTQAIETLPWSESGLSFRARVDHRVYSLPASAARPRRALTSCPHPRLAHTPPPCIESSAHRTAKQPA